MYVQQFYNELMANASFYLVNWNYFCHLKWIKEYLLNSKTVEGNLKDAYQGKPVGVEFPTV